MAASWVAGQLAQDQDVAVLLPDRGDRYFETVYSDEYLRQHGLAGVEAGLNPETLRYGVDLAERWSRAVLPHDGSVPYHAPEVRRTEDLAGSAGSRGGRALSTSARRPPRSG